MTSPADRRAGRADSDALALAAELPLTEDEATYVQAARAPNTLRGYRSDWSEFTTWCTQRRLEPLPADAATISGYLTELARHGAKVGTMSRRLSAIRFAHQLREFPDPTSGARVVAVWEGRRGGLEDLVRPPQLGVLPTQPGQLVAVAGRGPRRQPVVDIGLLAPAPQRVRQDPQLRSDPLAGGVDRQAGLLLAVPVGDSDSVSLGDTVTSVGNAYGRGWMASGSGGVLATGVSATLTDIATSGPAAAGGGAGEARAAGTRLTGLIAARTNIRPGESGGAMFNQDGEVIGINVAYALSQPGRQVGYAIPMNVALTVAHRLVAGVAGR